MIRKKTRAFVVVLIFFLLGTAPLLAVTAEEPLSQMKRAVEEIIRILQDKQLARPENKAERRKRVLAVVERNFNFEEMARRSLARNWKKRTPQEQKQFVDLFRQLLEHTYITKVDSYSDEKVVFEKQDIRGDRAVVYTNFIRNNIKTPVYYRLQNNGDRWLVYDVIIEGVSLVRNYRSQFDSIINREKYAGLVSKMKKKIVENAAAN